LALFFGNAFHSLKRSAGQAAGHGTAAQQSEELPDPLALEPCVCPHGWFLGVLILEFGLKLGSLIEPLARYSGKVLDRAPLIVVRETPLHS
jgi:hypothetical protein